MKYDAIICSARRDWQPARQFQALFENAEHTIVESLHDFYPNGWTLVNEWISRAHVHDRYIVWLVIAIKISDDGTVSQLDEPVLYVIEVENIIRSKADEGGAEWELGFVQFEEGEWAKLVENRGDFASIGFEMTLDSPIDRFESFWNDTRPVDLPEPSSLRAPFRYVAQSSAPDAES